MGKKLHVDYPLNQVDTLIKVQLKTFQSVIFGLWIALCRSCRRRLESQKASRGRWYAWAAGI